jgi:hypothetical protein
MAQHKLALRLVALPLARKTLLLLARVRVRRGQVVPARLVLEELGLARGALALGRRRIPARLVPRRLELGLLVATRRVVWQQKILPVAARRRGKPRELVQGQRSQGLQHLR